MGKIIGGSILLMTASILLIGNYLIAAILVNGQELSSTQGMVNVLTESMLDYIPFPHYLSILSALVGAGLLFWGLIEDAVQSKRRG